MAFINFAKGNRASYNLETYPQTIFFAQDTHELVFQGISYGFPNNIQAVKAVDINSTGLITITYVNGDEPTTIQLTKAMVGLSNVDNTSDASKPVSTATKQLIDSTKNTIDNYTVNGKKISTSPVLAKGDVGLSNVDNVKQIPATEKGAANGVVPLNADGKIDSAYFDGQQSPVKGVDGTYTTSSLPASPTQGMFIYTSDDKKFREYDGSSWEVVDPKQDTLYNFRKNPPTGDSSRVSILYRWDGEDLAEVSSTISIGEVTGTAYDGAKGKANRDAINSLPGTLVTGVDYSDADTDSVAIEVNIANKSGLNYGSPTKDTFDIPAATKTTAGVMTATDKTFVDGIRDGNLALPTPTIAGTWTFYKSDGTTTVDRSSMSPVPDANNPTIEEGYQAVFSGNYKWTHDDSKKDPTQVQSGSNWTDLPASGVNSQNYTSSKLTSNTTIKVGIQAAKTGLMVSGSNVLPATGMDTTTAQRTITFQTRRYFGATSSDTIDETTIKALSNELGGKSVTKSGVSATTAQYYIFAYPKSLGTLSTIIQDGATSVLWAFTRSELTITNAAGKSIALYVYRSNNKGAFTNAKLQFS